MRRNYSSETSFKIHTWMSTQLQLTNFEMMVYALIYSFSSSYAGSFTGSIDYVTNRLHMSRSSACRVLNDLVAKGCVKKSAFHHNGQKRNKYVHNKKKVESIDIVSLKHVEQSYCTVYDWMFSSFGLKGCELLVYALIHSFHNSERGTFFGSYKYIATRLGISERSARRSVDSLLKKQYVINLSSRKKGKTLMLRSRDRNEMDELITSSPDLFFEDFIDENDIETATVEETIDTTEEVIVSDSSNSLDAGIEIEEADYNSFDVENTDDNYFASCDECGYEEINKSESLAEISEYMMSEEYTEWQQEEKNKIGEYIMNNMKETDFIPDTSDFDAHEDMDCSNCDDVNCPYRNLGIPYNDAEDCDEWDDISDDDIIVFGDPDDEAFDVPEGFPISELTDEEAKEFAQIMSNTFTDPRLRNVSNAAIVREMRTGPALTGKSVSSVSPRNRSAAMKNIKKRKMAKKGRKNNRRKK